MTVHPPSAPQNLTHNGSLSFCSPQYNGGSRISEYEVHLKGVNSEDWYLLKTIPVKPLSDEPDIMEGNLPRDLKGSFLIRVTARNIGGLGAIKVASVTHQAT